jgi:hypothetical protein
MNRRLTLFRVPASLALTLALLASFTAAQKTSQKKPFAQRPAKTLPSSPENARILLDAYRVALAKPAVRRIARDEIHRQLTKNRPLLFVEGYWIVPIDMSKVYQNLSVRSALKASIAKGNGKPGRLTQNLSNLELGTKLTNDIGLTTAESALGLAILPMRRSPILNVNAELDKLLASMGFGKDAFEQSITDIFGIDDIVVIGVGLTLLGAAAIGYLLVENAPPPPESVFSDSGDMDHDGIANADDDDVDGDGFKNKDDRQPFDEKTHICDCGNLGGPTRIVGLSTKFTVELATSAINMLNMTKLESVRANTISLGSTAFGNAANNAQIRVMITTGSP